MINNFKALATKELNYIFETIDESELHDIDFIQDIIYIDTSYGQYVINIHNIMQQIWLSSPKSGPYHFNLQNDNWITSKNINLRNILAEELGVKL